MPILRITIESDALQGHDWTVEIDTLLTLADSCPDLEIRRTPGALRETSRGAAQQAAVERRRRALAIPSITEAFTLGASELGDPDSRLADDHEPARIEAVAIALWRLPPGALKGSRLEDVVHLYSHLRNARDLFVSTDKKMRERRDDLEALGIRVRRPPDALTEALEHCGRSDRFAFAQPATGRGAANSPEGIAEEWDADYHGGRRNRPARVRRVGMSLTRDDGLERSRRSEFDFKGDWYEETVLNPDGTVLHHQAEPLTKHRKHGSAKPTKRGPRRPM